MSRPSSKVKRRYNKSAYSRYEFSVNKDTKLDYVIEKFKSIPENNFSGLIRDLLAEHFGISPDELYVPFRYQRNESGQWVQIPNPDLIILPPPRCTGR